MPTTLVQQYKESYWTSDQKGSSSLSMVTGSFYKIMEKFELRNKVREVVKTMFEHSLERTTITIQNVTFKFDYCDDDRCNLSESWIEVSKNYAKQKCILENFYVQKYAGNDWDLIAEPWVCDMINDITDLVMEHIEEPKKKEF